MTSKDTIAYLESRIRNVPDFPKVGIQFKDITPLLADPKACNFTYELLIKPFLNLNIDYVLGMESRGFLFGPKIATGLNAGFIPVRKPGKLPYNIISANYELEYGTNSVEIHEDSIKPGSRVIIHDDLIATGGTASAATELVKRLGGEIIGYSFIIELTFLNGIQKLDQSAEIFSIIKY